MRELDSHPMFAYLRGQTKFPRFVARYTEGADAERTMLEIWAAFAMNPKNENGLVRQLSIRLPVAVVDHVPTITYRKRGIVRPVLSRDPQNSTKAYPQTYFVHIGGYVHELAIRKSLLIDLIIEGAERMHRTRGVPQERNATLFHLFEAQQLVARTRGLIEW